jgi:hypothetical protein
MQEIDHPPDAPSLLESMRSIGYSLESALADLVDNSIAARSKVIHVEFRPSADPYVALLDDGKGMNRAALETAMRHGSRSPLAPRDAHDLGRYGLGLKTASLSQCRRLTVISLQNGELSGYRWDLDRIRLRNAWTLLLLDEEEIHQLPHVNDLLKNSSGTLVLWQGLDRLTAGALSVENALGEQMSVSRDHLSLVFHRYINGEAGLPAIKFWMNGLELDAIDPFLLDQKATQRLVEDTFSVEGHRITVKPFILPHLSKLSAADLKRAGGSEGLRNQQGFYVYRNRRLIIWGTWFRLGRKDELSKLARVRVDIPNALDHLWTIDIKKSMAVPPEAVRSNLRRTIDRIRKVSGRTLVFRGRQASLGLVTTAWNEISDRSGIRFDINRKHPVISSFLHDLEPNQISAFEATLRVIEQSYPAEALYAQMATDVRPSIAHIGTEQDFRETIISIIACWSIDDPARIAFLEGLHLIEPFSKHPEISKKIVSQLLNLTER